MRDKSKPRYIYFAQTVETTDGRVKIGCSYKPAARLVALAVWSAYPIRIIAVAPGDFSDEKALHEFFADDRLHGEWFRCSAELLAVIDLMSTQRLSARDALSLLQMKRAA